MANENGKTKYYTLMEELKQAIMSGSIKPGEKLPSENELSDRYHISRHTVRKALSILINEGYIEAEHGRGTFCSQRMGHMKNSRNVAVVTTYISDYIFPRLIQGMDKVLTENGYSIILKNTANSRTKEERVLEDILTKDIEGLIIEPSKSQIYCKHTNLYAMLDQYEIPYVFIQGVYSQMIDKPHILMDDCKGGYMVTKHLIDAGHRKILGIFKADDFQGKERHKGYVKALQEAGIAYDPDMVVWFHTEDRKTKPAMMMELFLEQKVEMDAVVCYNDQIAIEVIRCLQRNGLRVPEDISVTGYDNSVIAEGTVGLTTITHPQEKLGEMAAELLLEKIRKVPEEKSRIPRLIQPELIVRGSTIERINKKEEREEATC
ncbi:MAG: GntR family transcriptional regulator [Blautia sp.]|nr:GntR family transcriptional regulator [Blautia sp.]MDD7370234.1 GntR family transcriptional regulator [Bacillota bacterium]MDY3715361.1 GntR family transcriptional regulator [Blautia sp.]